MGDYRVLVTGSRTWTDAVAIRRELDALLDEHGCLIVVHGAARDGADRIAHNWALSMHHLSSCGAVTPEPHPADWGRYKKRAGFVRNEEMVALGADVCLAFVLPCGKAGCRSRSPHPTHGTGHCINRAEWAGIPIRRFDG